MPLDPKDITDEDLDRFYSKIKYLNDNECYEMITGDWGKGYKRFYCNHCEITAHRFSLIIETGINPKDKEACHTCGNRKCVNPGHLYWGTRIENMNDVKIAGTLKGENSTRTKLTEQDILNIRASNLPRKELAKQYNLSTNHIGNIIRKETWKHI